jgi:hypothetical protein
MPYPKRIKPVEYLSEQAGHRSSQRKILRLKSFDARIEKRDLSSLRALRNWVAGLRRQGTIR